MRTLNVGIWFIIASTLCVASHAFSAEPAVDYEAEIKPLFERHCVSCHGAVHQQGGLRLDAIQFLREGGDSGFTVVEREPQSSVLVAALRGADGVPQMPKDAKPLDEEEISLIEAWIRQGATGPEQEEVEGDPANHWSFRPVRRPRIPHLGEVGTNPIDAFVNEKRDAARLDSVGQAPPNVLLRRVYLDLVGVPPTIEELHSFLADESPDAYERVVDRLLSDPRYGERWGRHWMDVWRYSDWYGYKAELRSSQRHIWHWRDWIVESLNENKPYDQMIVEMLAADEIAPTDDNALRATGFLARNYYKFNRDVWLDRTVEHTGKAFLGLTFNCARCHDHMFDPITQREHYAFRAFFEPHDVRVDPVDGILDELKGGLPRVFDAKLETPTYLYVRGNDKQPDKENPVTPALPAFLTPQSPEISSVSLPPTAFYPGLRPEVRQAQIAQAEAEVEKMRSALEQLNSQVALENEVAVTPTALAESRLDAATKSLQSLKARIAADDARYADPARHDAEELAKLAAVTEREANIAAAHAELIAKEVALADAKLKPEAEREKATKAAGAALATAQKNLQEAEAKLGNEDKSYTPLTKVYPETSSGRRTMLARWIANLQNPLTARVAVNQIWMRHFGRPIVESVFDFGMHGNEPTHPELLDWLAAELSEDAGWDMKHLHRLIVTSATYRLDSSAPAEHSALALDPDNRLLWRMNARRAEGEVVRDSLLSVSGRLETKIGGPELAEDIDQTTFRRSLYYRHAPEKYSAYLQLFDGASADECYRRAETVVPQQALAQMNSRLAREQSRLIANSLTGDNNAAIEMIVDRAFAMILCRSPESHERSVCVTFLDEQERRLADENALTAIENGPDVAVAAAESPRQRAIASLVHVLLNHHDFVTIR